MENRNTLRTRFAPSPSGIMHLGNVRSALFNFLCAKEQAGKFVLRIEDTDAQRTHEQYLKNIYTILHILSLHPDEGPLQGGPHAPYIQSQRNDIYQKYLQMLYEKGLIYRCFKTPEELENERARQIALKLPPRYQCVRVTSEIEQELLSKKVPFVWRLRILKGKTTFLDKGKGYMIFDLENFADCPLTRQDGTCTFLFANFIDDVEMKISYVIRGQEHLSNTVIQSYLYDILAMKKPLFYHLPLIVDNQGKKLSKRNFGFNIFDLLECGYLPQAIINYIAIIGMSIEHEIMTIDEMIKNNLFEHMKSTGLITYDAEKLRWINKKWLHQISVAEIKKIIYFLAENDIMLYKKNIHYLDLCDDVFLEHIKQESNTVCEFFTYIMSVTTPIDHQKIEFLVADRALVSTCTHFLLNNIGTLISKEVLYNFIKTNQLNAKKSFQIMRKILILQEEGIGVLFLMQYVSKDQIKIHMNNIVFV